MQPMRSKLAIVGLVMTLACTSSAWADRGPSVALIDTTRLYAPNGIAAWVEARARLDVERKTFVAVEAPDGQPLRLPVPDLDLGPAAQEKLRKEFARIEHESDRRRAWEQREAEVLDPIRTAVARALERYARTHGIELVLDRSQIASAVLVIGPTVDITDAFIRNFNASQSGPAKTKAKK